MPVAEDILETDAAGHSLVERTDGYFGDMADEIGLIHRIGFVARDDAGDAAAGEADRRQADGRGGKRCERDRHGRADAVRNACSRKPAIANTPSARIIRINSGSRPALIQRNRPPMALMALGFEREILADEFADRKTHDHRQQFDAAQGDHDRG
jgi:hypothetical protein